jgi:hypothetical protein
MECWKYLMEMLPNCKYATQKRNMEKILSLDRPEFDVSTMSVSGDGLRTGYYSGTVNP